MDKFIKKFKKGTQYVNVVSPVTANELTRVDGVSDDYLSKKCVKFKRNKRTHWQLIWTTIRSFLKMEMYYTGQAINR